MRNVLSRSLPKSVFLELEEPIRAEIFGTTRLESHAESLAHTQTVTDNPRHGRNLLPRIRENRKVLEAAYHSILNAVEKKRAITPAAEWLIDNFHIVRSQLKDIRDHLPPEYYRELPKIAEGTIAGYPRVYGIAWAFIAHTDSRFDPDLLKIFLSAYQKVQPLTIGELWAVPITLRLMLIENLRRIAAQIVGAQRARFEADQIADSLLGLGDAKQYTVEEVIRSLQKQPNIRSFAVQLLQRLRFQEAHVGSLLQYLGQKLAADGQVFETCVTAEHNHQSMANSTARNIITSSRLMSAFDWQEFFEQTSLVDQILREGTDFASMDFATRDRYRHRIEELARHSPLSEIEIAQKVVADSGYHLLGDGRFEFEKSIRFKAGVHTRFLRWYTKNGVILYLGSIFILSILISLPVVSLATNEVLTGLPRVTIFPLIFLLASEVAIACVNRWTIALLGPKHLPRLNLEKGISEKYRTFIVVPTMLTDEVKIREQLEQIEIYFLSNQDDNIYLALLTDFADSTHEHSDGDDRLIEVVFHELKLLNDRHPVKTGQHPRFSIYHRRRVFNSHEGCWMGWERKRGKLHEFNRLLLGAKDTTYWPFFGRQLCIPGDIRYVITLDADTKLPRGSVAQLVGTMAHQLNQPRFDETTGRVVSGYGILQPRITPTLPTRQDNTIFRRLSASRPGIDPYASAVSDVYQDLFEEGSYTGKGIYDLAAFERTMQNRIPENAILSHDLLEGNFVRCGFLSDVELFEDFPSHIGVATLRSHRWIRGDWQLLPWIFGSRGRSISIIGRWKMFDNLRRSLVAPAGLFLFFISGILPGVSPYPLFALLVMSLLSPALITLWSDLCPRRRHTSLVQHLFLASEKFRTDLAHAFLSLVLLPHNAWTSLDAIVRVLYRIYISRKKLLEWTTAAQVKGSANLDVRSFIRSMRGALFLTSVGLISMYLFNSTFYSFLFPLFVLWLTSPALARHFSLPSRVQIKRPVKTADIILLHSTARRIWRFFSTFVTTEDNFLPPDNYQEDPKPEVAHRSSPTNFGLYLLSILAARDFGWIGISEAVERMEATLRSLLQLPRHEGHFFNWYDTKDRRPLEPRYISSVDNGNLTGHLFVVAQGCSELLKTPIGASGFNRGILDTVLLLDQELNSFKSRHLEPGQAFKNVSEVFAELSSHLQTPDHLIEDWTHHWESLRAQSAYLVKQARLFAGDPVQHEKSEVLNWTQALQNDIQSSARDFLSFASWSDFWCEKLSADSDIESRHWWEGIRQTLRQQVTLEDLSLFCSGVLDDIVAFKKSEKSARHVLPDFLDSLLGCLGLTISQSKILVQTIKDVRSISRQLIREMDFRLLYDPSRKLFSIGMRVSETQLDPSYYDLLASEARLTSFIAIAKGDVPVSHWFHLSRNLVNVGQGTALVSWSGSMFEYLMPCLVMRSPEGSLLDETCRRVIARQIEYGSEKNVPWGISESAYNKRDIYLTYQYSNFGLPDLGLKRGLGADLVIAPYASLLAALYEPAQAAVNLRHLQERGALGPYGFYEAVDFTPSRLPEGRSSVIVRAYMAHHQGMALVALANVFKNSSMQRRFHSDLSVQATELLLQERTPRTIGTLPAADKNIQVEVVKEPIEHVSRRYHTANRPIPTTQLLSNGNYTVMVTSAGSGFSRVRDLAVTRWREDVTRDHYGYYIYLKDCVTQNVWSAGYQPICAEADHYEVSFSEDRARITREDHEITSELEIFVSPEENAEVRRLTLSNQGSSVREIEITSYSEVVLNSQGADVAHPAFSNLFVETEFRPELSTLIASRRPRSNKDKRLWLMHVLRADRHSAGPIQYETDRSLFIGRGRSTRNPAAIFDKEKLSGTVGPVLDPILSLRTRVRLEPGVAAHLTFSTGVADSLEAIEIMAEKFYDPSIFERASDLAWTQAQVKLHHLGVEPDEAHLFQRLTTRLLYADSSLRAPSEILRKNTKDLTGLWALGISGDHPIVLVRIDDIEDRNLIRQLLKAQIYLATKGFVSDLVILNEKRSSYTQELQTTLENMAQAAHTPSALSLICGKAFVLRGDLISESDHILLASEARVILSTRHGSLSDQVKRTRMLPFPPVKLKSIKQIAESHTSTPFPHLDFFNGYGGFSAQGDEYTIILKAGETTPAPWINIIANPEFGFQVSESGAGYTWSSNSRENQLTPWSNDPVCDPAGEAFFIRDRDSDALWSPTAAPIRLPKTVYTAHHGQGYSRFETYAYGISSELDQFVLPDHPVKISRLVLENRSKGLRRLSISGYVEWVLGFSRPSMAPTTITEFDGPSQAVFAFNPRNIEHGNKIAFSALLRGQTSFTCDRTEFIGRNSALTHPAALLRKEPLRGRFGGGLDPCTVLQTEITLKADTKVEIVFILGQASDRPAARDLISRLRAMNLVHACERIHTLWQDMLGTIQVETPDRSFDLVINRWYLYQTIVCRLWARAAFYQAGGAFGFRDQLQDVMALMISAPQIARKQLLLAASRQFIEGDVQHWWHPPGGRGVRTRFSDDLLWLPYVVSHYLRVTQDFSILKESIPFLDGPLLRPDQEDSYFTPGVSLQEASLYQHCARALDYSLKTGSHGLPLMGGGDWNDGMNHVGIGGKGESVWLAWFLQVNLQNFAPLAREAGEVERCEAWLKHAKSLIEAVENNAWDGAWYRRAFFDDGTPMGTAKSTECQIDSLAQTWAVISGAGQTGRAQTAMHSVYEHLVKPDNEMILLFTPPFDQTPLDPGYIKGYLPGVRENGGQYTHAGSWVVIATALLGDGKKAHELFSFLNPIHHTSSLSEVNRYKIEPYVLAGDVYSESPNTGRGGWSWYTGAAGWMYRAGVEFILGFQISGNELTLKPCVPPDWSQFKIHYRHRSSTYIIHVEIRTSAITEAKKLTLADDGRLHELNLKFGFG